LAHDEGLRPSLIELLDSFAECSKSLSESQSN